MRGAGRAGRDRADASDLEAIRGARRSPSRRCKERERSPTTTWPRSSTCSAASAGEAGRWIHFGLTSSDVLDTALALQLRAAGEVDRCAARARAASARSPRGRASTRTRCASGRTHGVHAEPTTFGLKLAGFAFEAAPQRASGCERAFEQAAVGRALGRGRHLRGARRPTFEARVLDAARAARARPSPRRSSPRDRHAELLQRDRARGRRARALRDRDPPPPAHRGARGRGAVPRGPEGLERDAAQAQPDHGRADHRPRARAARQRAGRRSRTSRCGTSATSRTPRVERVDPARLDDPARLPAAPARSRSSRA